MTTRSLEFTVGPAKGAVAGDAAWLEAAAREGTVLVISGDYLKITSTGLNIDAAARLGTLVTGNVSIPY